MTLATCESCGWVHFVMSRADAESSVEQFNKYFDSLDEATQNEFYGGKRAGIDAYESCFCCRGTKFRDYRDGDCPVGVTLNPIITEDA